MDYVGVEGTHGGRLLDTWTHKTLLRCIDRPCTALQGQAPYYICYISLHPNLLFPLKLPTREPPTQWATQDLYFHKKWTKKICATINYKIISNGLEVNQLNYFTKLGPLWFVGPLEPNLANCVSLAQMRSGRVYESFNASECTFLSI